MENAKLKDNIFGGILGLAVGDALGVPVEFQSRQSLRRSPVTDMRGYGTHDQPPGTWSDDTSLTLCLLDGLAEKGLDGSDEPYRPLPYYKDIMQRFLSWKEKGEYTAHGNVFDIGIVTGNALQRFKNRRKPLKCGGTSEHDNGNGSLMRILPMALYFPAIDKLYHGGGPSGCRELYVFLSPYVHDISSLTHAHKRCQIACGLYATIVRMLLDKSYLEELKIHTSGYCRCGGHEEMDLKSAIHSGLEQGKRIYEFLDRDDDKYLNELEHFNRLFDESFAKLPEEEIRSSGYVVDTLEAALWCLLNTDNYKDCVLKAVNLGDDTDTVAAVAGGLAGVHYGVDAIPKEWLNQLVRADYIKELCEKFHRSLVNYMVTWED
jgi:ADP-ribosylglycohydrolase